MKLVFEFLKLPLSLPISPLWEYIAGLIIGEIAYRVAYRKAGELGSTSNERKLVHWIIRIFTNFIVWLFVCVLVLIVKFIAANWIWVLVVLGIITIVGISILIVRKRRQKG